MHRNVYKIIMAVWLTVLLVSHTAVCQQEPRLGFDGEEATTVGILVYDLQGDSAVCSRNAALAMTPASILKAVTTAAALSMLGPDFRFTTEVALRGTRQKGIFTGDLVVTGAADPTLESSQFKDNTGFCNAIARALADKGITRLDGRIVVEQNLDDAGPVAQWQIEDVAYTYGAGLYGLNFRDNVFTLYPVTKVSKPHVPGLEVDLCRSTVNEVLRGINSNLVTVYRTNVTNKQQSLGTTMPDPSAVFADELKTTLSAKGITVTGRKKAAGSGARTTTLLSWQSPDAAAIMRSLMVRSDNMFAEGMLRAIAPGESRAAALKAEKQLWSERGLQTQFTMILDGSGLARPNRVSPQFMSDVLAYMAGSEMAETYIGFFPRVGVDGTVRSFLAKTRLQGHLALKTGSVNGVQCYAGYKLDANGKPTHTVVIMVNGFFCPRAQVKAAAERLLLETFENN